MTKDEALKLALEALVNSVDLVMDDAYNAEKLYGKYPSRQARVGGLKVLADDHKKAMDAIKEALAQPDYRAVKTYHEGKPVYVSQPAQEPVGKWTGKEIEWSENPYKLKQGQFMYTTPPQRPWVGLTDEEREYWIGCNTTKQALARAIDNALKEKNT